MDAKQFLGNFTDRADLLARAPYMLFAKCEEVLGVPCVTFGFTSEPKKLVEQFANVEERDLWWNEFTAIMMGMCTPRCVIMGTVLFQPMYLRRFVCYSNEQAHFVILDFGNNRAVWLGYHQKEDQIALFAALERTLASYLET
jgi:hypothetical protein